MMNYENFKLGSTPSFIQQLDMSVHPDHAWWDREISNVWPKLDALLILSCKEAVADTFVLSYLADILPPVVQNKYGSLGWVPTLTLTCNIRQLPQTNNYLLMVLQKTLVMDILSKIVIYGT